ncbi:DUF2441 domain-containing protein [Enterobacter hormaechei]
MSKRKYTLYHADRGNRLTPCMEIKANEQGLSLFGEHYLSALHSGDISRVSDPAVQREAMIESVRQQFFQQLPSRFECMFGATTIEDACYFAKAVTPMPSHPIKIYEVFCEAFSVHDMNWLDYENDNMEVRINYCKQYWWTSISQHRPQEGEMRIPRLEALIRLPATVGNVVYEVPAP